ncbi:MAG: four helix bundle protein [Planctomycetota bacterium]|nr:MAG: four helix bundle protein [Planctomycetota bacterium]
MTQITGYRDLEEWKLSMKMAKDCYLVTRGFPKEELFGMTSQIRRSAASIPANIAEGYGRDQLGEYVQFLRIAQGRLKELETHLLLCIDVGLAKPPALQPIIYECERIGRMLSAPIRKLKVQK